MSEVTLGGERLGGGKKNKIYLRNYERSTHDKSFIWRSTMASGTLVPFWTEVALPGDTFDVELNCNVLTHPTIGPLFGSYKVHLDVFQIPIRLYQAQLHMNKLGIGMKMADVKLPLVQIRQEAYDASKPIDQQGINPSCIFSYLGIRGVGKNNINTSAYAERTFNAIPYIGYWDIYKNYYANKQEEIGAVIHKNMETDPVTWTSAKIWNSIPDLDIPYEGTVVPPYTYEHTTLISTSYIEMAGDIDNSFNPDLILFFVKIGDLETTARGTDIFTQWDINETAGIVIGSVPNPTWKDLWIAKMQYFPSLLPWNSNEQPQIETFPLSNIDALRDSILKESAENEPFIITSGFGSPFKLPLLGTSSAPYIWANQFSQEGLALRTYASDLFNNWISTEWIDGDNGISAITAVDTSSGSFTIDELNLSKKVYDMLNRIAISGGSYDDWLDAVYTHDRQRSAENPIYLGGMIKNIVFQEVISNAQTSEQPLGTLAGRGTMGSMHKGGKIVAKIDEPSYLMGIVSIVPNIDYSQGNQWDVNLRTMDDFHKPALDEIGFQDLITDQMAFWDTNVNSDMTPTFKSAGKQPAWINYMTNVNVVRGNFALESEQMYMTLNRRYEAKYEGGAGFSIKDLTTYIDPSKFNHIFADTRRDAQNFWTQIGLNITARRKMSAKVMPNL